MSDNCETLYNILPGFIFPILFVASELLPLTSKTKSNGLLHMILLTITKYYTEKNIPQEESCPLLEEV